MKMKSVFTNITAGLCFAVLVLSMGYMSFCRNKQEDGDYDSKQRWL